MALFASIITRSKKGEYMSATEASSYLSEKSGIKKNYTYWLGDNRRGRHKGGVGVIPPVRKAGKIYYKRAHIEAVARELYLHSLFGAPIKVLFP